MKRLSILLLSVLCTAVTAFAYNFQSGDLYYNITSDTTVEVTFQEYQSETNYQGLSTASIPETVTYNGTTYSVTSIGDYAFDDCSSLTSITIPNSVTSIGERAFCECSSLTSITIPNSVTSIGMWAFEGCSSLTSIVVESDNTVYDSRDNCNAIIETATNTLIVGCQSTTIPNSVTSIGGYAFYYCSSLSSITIPNSVTSIGGSAFEGCSSLSSITIPNSVAYIGGSAFFRCSSLTSITIPNSVTSIGNEAFRYCSSLTSITIPESITSIESGTFDACSSLTSITIPNSVTYIGGAAFFRCSSLTSITIPNSVTSIGYEAFAGCSSLTSMMVESGNTVYDTRENCNAIIETATNTLIACCQSTTIPNSVTSIGNYAFSFCSSLSSITIPNSVTSIGDGAFYYCFSLTSITIPNSETSIGNYAFYYCFSLTSITIPNSVTSIGKRAFYNCSALTQITCLTPTPPTCGYDCFYDVPRNIPLYVSAESVEAYKAAETWKEFDVQALSTDATLSSLTYDGMMVPFFDADTLHYTVELPSETVATPVVDAVANDLNAQVVITQAVALPGEASVEVIAADGTTRQTYTIYFSKKSTPTAISDRPDTTETVSDKGAEKLLRNGQVLILRNGETYDMMGQML